MKRLQCKDIPDLPILDLVRKCSDQEVSIGDYQPIWATQFGPDGDNWDGYANSVRLAMPPGVPDRLVLAKMEGLIRRGLVQGCTCGCRGDFEITDAGRLAIQKLGGEGYGQKGTE